MDSAEIYLEESLNDDAVPVEKKELFKQLKVKLTQIFIFHLPKPTQNEYNATLKACKTGDTESVRIKLPEFIKVMDPSFQSPPSSRLSWYPFAKLLFRLMLDHLEQVEKFRYTSRSICRYLWKS